MNLRLLSYLGIILLSAHSLRAADLTEATFSQVVNQVNITDIQGKKSRPATIKGKFAIPEILRTGANSRAELVAADHTVTRVGANTIFSFKPSGRSINLQQGSILFNPQPGQGGGTIQTAAATASVLGTTIIVSFDPKAGCKLLVLEGKSRITLPNGKNTVLYSGQMILIPMGATQLPPVYGFILEKTKKKALLISGFDDDLPSLDKILAAITEQNKLLANGDLRILQSGADVFGIDPNTQQAYLLQQQERHQQAPPPNSYPYSN